MGASAHSFCMLLLVEQVDMCTIDMTHAKLVFNGSLSKKAQARTSMSAKVTPFDADHQAPSQPTGSSSSVDSASSIVTLFGTSMEPRAPEDDPEVRVTVVGLCP